MFEGLDQVPWAQLNDAYGPSRKTPRYIRDLVSPDESARENALSELSYTIYHQGSIYPAAVAAVPFLVEIVSSDQVPDRTPAIELLETLNTGGGWHDIHGEFDLLKEAAQGDPWQKQVALERQWVTDLQSAILKGSAAYLHVLATGRSNERLAATHLVAALPATAETTQGLVDASGESHPTLRAAALYALGSISRAHGDLFLEVYRGEHDPFVRVVAAILVVSHLKQPLAAECVEHLMRELREPTPGLEQSYRKLTRGHGTIPAIARAVSHGERALLQQAFPLILRRVKASHHTSDPDEVMAPLLLAVLMDKPRDWKWTPEAITQEQRAAIDLVAARAWTGKTIYGDIVDIFRAFRLPDQKHALAALLGRPVDPKDIPKPNPPGNQQLKKLAQAMNDRLRSS